jgi:hypothetical protein
MVEPDYQTLRTAAELDRVAEAVASGALQSSIYVIGPGGVGTARSAASRGAIRPA